MSKFIEFNHSEVIFEIGIQERLPRVFNANVKMIEFTYDEEESTQNNYADYNSDTVFQQLPNIEEVSFSKFEMSKLFVKIYRDFGQNLTDIVFYFRSNDENYYLLAEVMRTQSSNCCEEVYNDEIAEDENVEDNHDEDLDAHRADPSESEEFAPEQDDGDV
uniref:Uncharacterized protein n=1 Tax=Panagrolaimus sp. JU765 TaxID=591449 RepID=A0AC34QDP9_9BILA